jgi:hypothetical protein
MKYTLLVIGLVTTLSALTQEYQAAKKVRAGIFLFQIRERFDSVDTRHLEKLKEQ